MQVYNLISSIIISFYARNCCALVNQARGLVMSRLNLSHRNSICF
ncbi:hypothetical protein HanXRQr2_Chr13g0570481 [Helianthus annuus]|uniref:Uncharacterized protein n=1 Tax=Helianthus annuus TaxID=4232 RepID=A0A9K3H9E3_HELAN|nr:hypothetical protein HanXRQr2_Chr13g0570481 [Helianthus annuus]KAJ0847783.1 hypothetical protein HanPSC8_Chr13g0549291 [Helianthus annuus]